MSRTKSELVALHPNVILANLSIIAYHPASPQVRTGQLDLYYDSPAPNDEPEWDLFEEGRWYHPPFIDLAYARSIHMLVHQVNRETGERLIPKLKRRQNVLGPQAIPNPSSKHIVEEAEEFFVPCKNCNRANTRNRKQV